jgi:nucleoside-diphosphate-sugar epimerase
VALMSADQVIDASRIREELGWAPKVEFSEGMRRMKDWRRQMSNEEPMSGEVDSAAATPSVSR